MSFSRYLSVIETGSDWLPELPSHWQIARLKEHCDVFPSNVDKKSQEGEQSIRLCNYTDVYYNDVITSGLDFMMATASADQVSQFALRAGDVLITKDSETADDIGVSAHVPQDLPDVVCGYHLAVLRPTGQLDGAFLKRLFDSHYVRSSLEVRANGLTRVGLSHSSISTLALPLPPLPEQHLIAAFLERETAKIDALVAEQERLIELLTEKRHAVISHAVSKGLNPDVRFRSSGSGWIGDVPEHWTVQRMRSVATMDSGHTPDKKIPEYWNGSLPWVSLNDTAHLKEHDYISDTVNHISQAGLDNSSAHLLPAGAVVFSRDATIGRCAITTRPMAVSQHFIAWICGTRIVPEYLLFRLRSMTQELESMTTGATVKTIGMPEVNTLLTPIPPIEEQEAIVDRVRKLTAMIDSLNTDAEKAVQLLRERRSALISAAVTGQIDVRGLAEAEVA